MGAGRLVVLNPLLPRQRHARPHSLPTKALNRLTTSPKSSRAEPSGEGRQGQMEVDSASLVLGPGFPSGHA